ncbi:MAG: hypothetical protein LUF30_04635 [Lachnospiraceae bacterium]|nr:hypothetical protein [Lachnospiraceae bacterium]
MELYQGKSVCAKTAIGKVCLYRREKIQVVKRHVHDTEAEVTRFHSAQSAATDQLDCIWKKAIVKAGPDDAAVFIFHKLLLRDPDYEGIVLQTIREEQVNAEYAIAVARDQLMEQFGQMTDRYMRARAADISDISERLLTLLDADPDTEEDAAECTVAGDGITECAATKERATECAAAGERATPCAAAGEDNLNARSAAKRKTARRFGPDGMPIFPEPVILMADEMAPSEAVLLDQSKILAIVTCHGSADSHASILSRSMGIPSVTGIDIQDAWDGRMAIVDGDNGTVIIDPEPDYVKQANLKIQTGA